MIDYEKAKREAPALKSTLTKAKGIMDPLKRYLAVREACTKAVRAWEQWGAWPDNWSLWQRTMDDAGSYYASVHGYGKLQPPRLEEL